MIIFNWKALQQDILISFRSTRSSEEILKELGFNFNKYQTWESSSQRLSWLNFYEICNLTSFDISKKLKNTLDFSYTFYRRGIPRPR